MSILHEIIAHKVEEVADREQAVPQSALPKRQSMVRDFQHALDRPGLQIIAEVKRKSPSKGEIHAVTDPVELAKIYETNGAAAISVLTDEKYFGGSLTDLTAIRGAVKIPILRKDFILTPYQVLESYASEADSILLIADALSFDVLHDLYDLAVKLGLHVLVEAYSDEALAKITQLSPSISGVNSRDLSTMELSLQTMAGRYSSLPEKAIKVAESGIMNVDDIRLIANAGYDAALIGTALLQNNSPARTLASFVDAAMGVAP